MDLNSLTWLLVTCVLFQMYTTVVMIQSTCSSGDATTWHPDQVHLLIFNTLHDAPPSSLLDPKRVQLCQIAEVNGTWCRSQLLALKGGERGVLKAPRLD
jgi:hypothetical protein